MKKSLAVFAGIAVLCTTSAFAACVDTYGIGSKATAMGGAYSAYANDPFAVHYNPAGLSQITRPTIAAGAHVIDPSLTLKGFRIEGTSDARYAGKTFRVGDDFPILVAPHLGYAMPLTEKISFGIAAYAPFGLETRWPKDITNPSRHDSYHSYYERLVVTPSLSYKVNDKLSLGFGVSLGYSKSGAEKFGHYFDSATDKLTALNNFATTGGMSGPYAGLAAALLMDEARIDAEMDDDINYSVNVGIMYKPVETITLGLTYRSQTQAKFSGDIKVSNSFLANMGLPTYMKGKVSMQYDHPQQVQAGIRYQPHDKFSMEFDIVWTNWSINKRQTENISLNVPGLGPVNYAMTYARNWEDTRQIRFGAEYIVNDWFTLRGGYFYDPTPIPDDTLDTMWPDADKKTYSIGAGFTVTPNLTIDTVFQLTHIEQDRTLGGESVNMNHAYGSVNPNTGAVSYPKVSAEAEGYLFGFGVTVSYAF
ncbi:outer membrane protein transport protein [Desulfococcaceae bacterium OttesenSCG-928-F15]|nr:outer membrane protein transport protein [Desulfococcaceae bacterium OttesenSCG-928-F15]